MGNLWADMGKSMGSFVPLSPMREKEGWVCIKGGRNGGERFKVEWQVGAEIIIAEQDDWDGTITERLRKPKK
jgi:hypothetical protein